jgi:hypothetical protein
MKLTLALVIVVWALPAAAAAPVIDSLTATPDSVAPGGTVTLEVKAHDPDCPDVCASGCGNTIRWDMTNWSATGGSFTSLDDGVTGSPYTASAEWQAPLVEAIYDITVELADSGTWMCGGQETVTQTISVQVTSTPNNPPVIDSLTAGSLKIFPGESTDLSCSASDPDGDPVTYSWSSDLGTVTPGTGGSASFSAANPGVATVTCTATDPQLANGSADISIVVSDVVAERRMLRHLAAPARLAADSTGYLYVADPSAGGITVLKLADGSLVYRLTLPDITSVAVDWTDNLLIGSTSGAAVHDRNGNLLLSLDGVMGARVSDVAVDLANQRYGVLYSSAGRVVVYASGGGIAGAFGSVGDGPEQLKRPSGIAFGPAGEIVVSDTGHGQVKVYDLGGSLLQAMGDLGGGAGEFVQLDDVAVDAGGVIYASDSYQDWVQTFNPDGTLREVLGSYGDSLGQLKTPTGVLPVDAFGKLVVASANTSSLQVFNLAAPEPVTWPQPAATYSTTSIVFPDQTAGTFGTVRTVTVGNSGSAPLGVHRVGVSGAFVLGSSCSGSLDPGSSCSISVRFAPPAAGVFQGELVIETSAPGSPQLVSLQGLGYLPAAAALSTNALDFGDVGVGVTSAPQTVTLSNNGTAGMTVTSIVAPTHFGLTSTCPATIPGGGSCSIDVYFTPTISGDPINGSVAVNTSATGSPHLIAVSGRALLYNLAVNPADLVFPNVLVDSLSNPEILTITNTGTGELGISQVSLAGIDANDFKLRVDRCSGLTLAVDATCTVEVVFAPTTSGFLSAEVNVATVVGVSAIGAVSGGQLNIDIFADNFESGNLSAWSHVVPAKILLVTPSDVDLGEVKLGAEAPQHPVTLTNRTSRPLYLGVLVIPDQEMASFQIGADDTCSGTWLEAGASCSFTVILLTIDAGEITAEVEAPVTREGGLESFKVPVRGVVFWPEY